MTSPEHDDYDPFEYLSEQELGELDAIAQDEQADRDVDEALLDEKLWPEVERIMDTQNLPAGEAWRKVGRPSPVYEAMANGTFALPTAQLVADAPVAEQAKPARRRTKKFKPNPARIPTFIDIPEGPSVKKENAIDAFETIFTSYNLQNQKMGAQAMKYSPFPGRYGRKTNEVIANMDNRVDVAKARADRALNVLVNPVGLADLEVDQFTIDSIKRYVKLRVEKDYGPLVKDVYGNTVKGFDSKYRNSALGKMKTSLKKAEKKKNS